MSVDEFIMEISNFKRLKILEIFLKNHTCIGAQPLPTLTREQLKPPKQSYALTYFNVGVSFFLLGTFMILTSVIPDNYLGSNWTRHVEWLFDAIRSIQSYKV